ncbi:helix-turn-helix domain-containing protein, partial [Candidatus Terasakiella magnetica]|uniref:helix-turn-helix domain-containing protein n=1 Tax=Candidatus Terasakiella magnetica TaxID=1867952 RepID=UPI0010420E41
MGQKYEHLRLDERIEIYRLHEGGISLRQIAQYLGRSASTISRELRPNSKKTKQWDGGYKADRAHDLALRRRRWDARFKLARQPALRELVRNRLAMGWSPEQIAGR